MSQWNKLWISGLLMIGTLQTQLEAHCQLPCGIYHDDMVFDQIDQYVETMVKCISVLNDSKFSTVEDKNAFIRWIMQKENSSNEIAELILTYFLQQKIKPDEQDTPKRLISAHRMLFLLVKIKQTADLDVVGDFYEEWERFKLMFHIEGYSCKVEQIKLKEWAKKKKMLEQEETNTQNPSNGQPQLRNEARRG